MCTAIALQVPQPCFGRTLDHTCSYGESVTLTPRCFPLHVRDSETLERHYAILGIAHVESGYPLYYDGVNEKGLAMAGLNFTESADYGKPEEGKINLAHFEVIPWILGRCATVAEAEKLLVDVIVTDSAFSPQYPPAKLHWMLTDGRETLVLEAMADGLHVHNTPVGILTNEPPFPVQIQQLRNYVNLTAGVPENRFLPQLPLRPCSCGVGAMGLPGDLSSQSRFVRAAFFKFHAETGTSGTAQMFHLLDTVKMVKGCCRTEDGSAMYTLYQSCYDLRAGICCYTTYEDRQITAVEMRKERLHGDTLVVYPLGQAAQNGPDGGE